MLLTNIAGVLIAVNYSLPEIEGPPLAALDWAPGITQKIGPTRLIRFFARSGKSRFKRTDYRFWPQTLIVATPGKSDILPFDMAERRRIIVRFGLFAGDDFPEWLTLILYLTDRLVGTPAPLESFPYTDAATCALLFANDLGIMRLWQAACVVHGSGNRAIFRIPGEPNDDWIDQDVRAPSSDGWGRSTDAQAGTTSP